MTMRPIATVADCRSPVGAVQRVTFDMLAASFAEPKLGAKDGPGWLPADIEVGPRNGERVKSISFLALDVEADAEPVKDENGKSLRDGHGDIIKRVIGPEPPDVDTMLAELALHGWRCILHTSYSHGGTILPEGIEHPRYRLIFDLSRSLAPAELKPLGLHVASLLGIADCIDTKALESARLFYVPRCPDADRASKYRHAVIEGEPVDVDALLGEMRRIEAARKAALTSRRPPASASVIEAFNAQADIASVLEEHGYSPKGRRRWLFPGSTTGLPGVRLLPDDGRGERVYSSHGGDPLNDGHAHDAFDCWRILDHGGDMTSAVKEAARLLGLDGPGAAKSSAAVVEYRAGEEIPPAGDSEGNGWPDPQPLTAKIEPEPYPLDAFPQSIRAAVEEVAVFVKAPVPLVASSALAALSLACQAHIDVKRLEKLSGPVGLFILVIADSGERKSTCDGFFAKAITDYEEAQAEAARPILKDHKAASEAWEAKRQGIKEKIRQLAKEQKPTAGMESALRDLEHDKPEPPRIPRLLYADATPEALAYGLAKQWPSGGVVSAEAGIVFGSHGMGKDSVMRNLGLLNQLWDGKTLTIDRRSTESFSVRGARLTVALQVQEPTLREFFARSGALARGTGFLARFLVAWPESTQGMRMIDPDAPDGPKTWPHLAAFHRRIAAILDQPAPIGEDGALTPAMLALAPDAKAAWVDYHNAIEGELSSGGELYDVRDVASKSADNAARLAALFQLFEHGMGGAVGLEAFEGASRITAWHLHEARRFFGELALPAELADAARLDSWLTEHCRRERTHLVPTREAQRLGPIRDKEKLTAALRELEELDRVRVTQEGRRKTIQVNPALVGATR